MARQETNWIEGLFLVGLGSIAFAWGGVKVVEWNKSIKPGIEGHRLCLSGQSTGEYRRKIVTGEVITVRNPYGGIIAETLFKSLKIGAVDGKSFVVEGQIEPNTDPKDNTNRFNPSYILTAPEIVYRDEPAPDGSVTVVFESPNC